MVIDFPSIIGLIGVVSCVSAYVLLQLRRMDSNGILFSLLNFLGSVLILISIYYYWNVASFAMESIWMAISLYGFILACRNRRKRKRYSC